jgi:hypothetical protein
MKKIKITEYQYKRLREQSEEFNPDDLTSPEISISPRTHLKSAEKQYEWEAYIPEISRKIKFYLNPEEWNLIANVSVEKIESSGRGSWGDESHRDYSESPLDNIDGAGGSVWYKGTVIGKGERYDHVDIKEAINDIKNYSEEAAQLTIEYKQQIQQITKQFSEKIGSLKAKHKFNGNDSQKLVTVDSKGNMKTEEDFEKGGNDWWGHDRDYRRDHEDYDDRKL